MLTDTDLARTLRALPVRDVRVRVEGSPGHLVAEVCSPDFAEMDDARRQQAIWGHLMDTLTDDQRVAVEFVFALSPEEFPVEGELVDT